MTAEQRFVFDTNVLISALAFPGSTPRKAFDLAMDQGVLLVSEATMLELRRTLRRPKLARYFGRAEQEAFTAMLVREASLVEVTERFALCRDPRDDKFLELAVAGRASELITGDRDLLAMNRFRGIRIATPAALVGLRRR